MTADRRYLTPAAFRSAADARPQSRSGPPPRPEGRADKAGLPVAGLPVAGPPAAGPPAAGPVAGPPVAAPPPNPGDTWPLPRVSNLSAQKKQEKQNAHYPGSKENGSPLGSSDATEKPSDTVTGK